MAEQRSLKLIISRVDGPLFDGEVAAVTVPATEGEMTILALHEALISPLSAGTITIKKADETTETVEIQSGTIEISNNQATVLL